MDISLFRSIASQYKELRQINTVSMMNIISHQIEDQIFQHQLSVDFYAGFQRFSNFPEQMRRYSRLGATCRRIYVFGVADYQQPSIPGVEFVELAPTSALTREWFLLVDTPEFWATLVAQEVEGKDPVTGGRRFDGLWSFDEQIVDRITLLMSQILETPYQPVTHRNYSKQNAHVTEIGGRLLKQLEKADVVSQRRWVQMRIVQRISELRSKNVLELVRNAGKVLQTMFGCAGVIVALRTTGQNYTVAVVEGEATGQGWKIPLNRGIIGQTIQQGRLVQLLAIKRYEGEPLMPTAKAVISAPIIGSRVHGAVLVGNAEANRWNEEDGQTIATIAKILAIQLEQVLILNRSGNSSAVPVSGIRT